MTQMVKNLPAMWETQVRSLVREDPLEKEMYSHLENPIDRGAWQATVHGVTKSWTRLSDQQEQLLFSEQCPLDFVHPIDPF